MVHTDLNVELECLVWLLFNSYIIQNKTFQFNVDLKVEGLLQEWPVRTGVKAGFTLATLTELRSRATRLQKKVMPEA